MNRKIVTSSDVGLITYYRAKTGMHVNAPWTVRTAKVDKITQKRVYAMNRVFDRETGYDTGAWWFGRDHVVLLTVIDENGKLLVTTKAGKGLL